MLIRVAFIVIKIRVGSLWMSFVIGRDGARLIRMGFLAVKVRVESICRGIMVFKDRVMSPWIRLVVVEDRIGSMWLFVKGWFIIFGFLLRLSRLGLGLVMESSDVLEVLVLLDLSDKAYR